MPPEHRGIPTPLRPDLMAVAGLIQPGERVEESLRLPPGVQPAPQRKLIDHPDWEIQVPTRRGIIGFLFAWIMVLGLIAAMWLVIRLGA